MKLLFEQKKPGRKRDCIEPVGLFIEGKPTNVSSLIEMTVRSVVAAFNGKISGSADYSRIGTLNNSDMEILASTGKIAFGIIYDDRTADADKAVENALTAYSDGLFLMFLNGEKLGGLDEIIKVKDNDLLTVVRLTMLSGRMW